LRLNFFVPTRFHVVSDLSRFLSLAHDRFALLIDQIIALSIRHFGAHTTKMIFGAILPTCKGTLVRPERKANERADYVVGRTYNAPDRALHRNYHS
jgi:hypothetical protein